MENLSIRVSFDFNAKKIVLSGIADHDIIRSMTDDSLQYIEYTLNDLGEKWIFIFKKVGNEEFFEFSQYIPWTSTRPVTHNYKYYSNIARWSFIPFPSKYTIQKGDVYKNFYHEYMLHKNEIKNIVFETIGSSTKDWNTDNAITGYWC